MKYLKLITVLSVMVLFLAPVSGQEVQKDCNLLECGLPFPKDKEFFGIDQAAAWELLALSAFRATVDSLHCNSCFIELQQFLFGRVEEFNIFSPKAEEIAENYLLSEELKLFRETTQAVLSYKEEAASQGVEDFLVLQRGMVELVHTFLSRVNNPSFGYISDDCLLIILQDLPPLFYERLSSSSADLFCLHYKVRALIDRFDFCQNE